MGDLAGCKLVIVGEYDQHLAFHRELKALIASSKADIEWVGFLDDAATSGLLQVTDMVVLPYEQPVSLRRSTLLSSLVHGKPVITTGPASPPLINKQNCYLIDSNDPDTIVNAVEELRNNSKLSTMLAERAARLAADFNWERIASKHVELYQKLLGGPHS
jgi:glycosyltransferase involved in cell wall biosynthesis